MKDDLENWILWLTGFCQAILKGKKWCLTFKKTELDSLSLCNSLSSGWFIFLTGLHHRGHVVSYMLFHTDKIHCHTVDLPSGTSEVQLDVLHSRLDLALTSAFTHFKNNNRTMFGLLRRQTFPSELSLLPHWFLCPDVVLWIISVCAVGIVWQRIIRVLCIPVLPGLGRV